VYEMETELHCIPVQVTVPHTLHKSLKIPAPSATPIPAQHSTVSVVIRLVAE